MNRIISWLVVALVTVGIAASCSNPVGGGGSNGSSSSTSGTTVSGTTLTIQPSSATKPTAIMSYYPSTATIKKNGSYYSFDSLASSGSTNSASTPTSAYVVYSVNAVTAGTYNLRLYYAFGGTETNLRDAWVVVNGAKVVADSDTILEFAYAGVSDGKWTTYAYSATVSIPLVAGDNEIRIVAVNTAGYSRNITYARTGSGGTVGTTGTGYVTGLPNISALEISGSSNLSAGSGNTSLYSLTTSVKNGGTGTIAVSPSQDYYLPGTTVTLTATAGSGYDFDSWEGGVSSRLASKTLTIGSNTNVTARFVPSGATNQGGLIGFGAVQDDAATPYTLTGGLGGTTVTVSTLADLQTYLTSSSPYIVIIDGEITSGSDTKSTSITVASNKTIYGSLTNQGKLKNIELKLNGENYIVRNLVSHEVVAYDGYAGSGNDNITINGGKHIWIDHCEFYSQLQPVGAPDFNNSSDSGSDGVIDEYDYKDYYDGQIDISDAAVWITISNCYFHDHWKSLLWGGTDGATADAAMRITLYHNYFKNIMARLPLLRYGKAHVFNNYYEGITSMYIVDQEFGNAGAGVDTRNGSTLYVQGNYYRNLKYPIFSSDNSGYINSSDNQFVSCINGNAAPYTSSWTPAYAWTADSAANIGTSTPSSWAGVGIMGSLP